MRAAWWIGGATLALGVAAGAWLAFDVTSDGPEEGGIRAGLPDVGDPPPTIQEAVPDEGGTRRGDQPNIALIVLDDVGTDMVRAYGHHPRPVRTPNLDKLAAQGMRFESAVANPLCSPTRATMLTGRYSFRYGVGGAIPPKEGWGLPETERSLATALKEGSDGAYRTAVVGKWHLASPTMGGWDHPRKMGFDHHVGSMGNLHGLALPAREPMRYDLWTRVIDGTPMVETRYATTATVDDALEVAPRLGEPWFMWVAFNAAHFPMHAPPRELLPPQTKVPDHERGHYRAMVQALDTEVGRLVDGLRAQSDGPLWIVLLADNGSAPVGVLPPWPRNQAKGSMRRGGVRVPMIVSGPGVPAGSVSEALVNTTDLYATVLELAGVQEPLPEDSVSFVPVLTEPTAMGERQTLFSESFKPNGPPPWETHRFMVRDQLHKVVREADGTTRLFDLRSDPMEQHDLLEHAPTPEQLETARALLAKAPYDETPTLP